MKTTKLFVLALLVASFATSTATAMEYATWLGNVYEFEAKGIYEYAHSNKLDTAHGDKSHTLHSNLLKVGLLFTPHPEWDLELEAGVAETTKHNLAYDETKLAVRHVWLNELTGDPVSLTTGVTLGLQQEKFLRDLSLIRHGPFEALFHVAVGREFGYSDTQYYNAWVMGQVGTANKSSDWVHAEGHLDWIISETHFFDLFLKLERGSGDKKLHTGRHFHGYSHIAYRFADLGLRYEYCINSVGKVYVEAKKRLHARFCPKGLYALEVGFDIPFSF